MEKRSKIKNLNKGYFQKSMFFLYPLLKISKKLLPVNTYISWSYKTGEKKRVLICRYKDFISPADQNMEKQLLLNHAQFVKYYSLEDGTGVYLFTLNDKYDQVWDLFEKGSYSSFPYHIKMDILSFYRPGTSTYDYINSYLNPSEYYNDYAELLNIEVSVLKNTKELIDKPDVEKETLKEQPKKIDLSSYNLKQ